MKNLILICNNPGSGSHLSREFLQYARINGLTATIHDYSWKDLDESTYHKLLNEILSYPQELIYSVDQSIFDTETLGIDYRSIEFIRRLNEASDKRFRLSVMLNIRHPLDHISSYHGRFGNEVTLEQTVNRVKNYLKFVEFLQDDFPKELISVVKFEDVVKDYAAYICTQEKAYDMCFPKDIMIHGGSVNRWGGFPEIQKLLEDKELFDLSARFDYEWPKGLMAKPIVYRTRAFVRAEITDFVLWVGQFTGKVQNNEIYYSSANRHHYSSYFVKNIRKQLSKFKKRNAGAN